MKAELQILLIYRNILKDTFCLDVSMSLNGTMESLFSLPNVPFRNLGSANSNYRKLAKYQTSKVLKTLEV